MLDKLWELIEDNIHTSATSTRDWHSVLCSVCNDHGRKGKRAGFKKEDSAIGYNCFNCGAKFKTTLESGITNSTYRILNAFGVETTELDKLRFEFKVGNIDTSQSQREEFEAADDAPTISPIKIPIYFSYLNKLNKDDVFYRVAEEHLRKERRMATSDYPFLICTDETLINSGLLEKFPFLERWNGRLIIPIFYNGRICHYMGYDLSESRPQKYLNSSTDNRGIMYGMERLSSREETPLFITEGFFDAFHINGIAVFTNRINDEQMFFLRKSKRRIVVIPDRGDPHSTLAEQAMGEGWEISLPDLGTAKDVCESVIRFGKPYTLKAIYDGIQVNPSVARLKLRIYKGRKN